MMLLRVAFRNILRNARRSAMTILAIALGALGILAFAGFMAYMVVGFRTTIIEANGHISVMRKGLYSLGSGNPAAYGIAHYQDVIDAIVKDPTLGPMINVITPTVSMFGLAANFDKDSSRTFLGTGIVPKDRTLMRFWDESGIMQNRKLSELGLDDADPQRGVLGTGLARILGLCNELNLPNCFEPPKPAKPAPPPAAVAAPPPPTDFAELAGRDLDTSQASRDSSAPRIDLLSATAGGSPNVVSLYVAKTQTQGARQLDDGFVLMHISLAQQLLYGRGEPKATSLVIQLHHFADMSAARHRLDALFQEKGLDLEVHDFTELTPMYNQMIGLFGAIFVFIAVVMGVIILFSVANTMTMSVMERVNEIGTTRALGVRRSGIRGQFLAEGAMLGVIGVVLGLALTELVAYLLDHADIRWTPPGQAYPIPLRLLPSAIEPLMALVVVILIAISLLAVVIPANRAARMPVVDALRHV